MDKRTSPRTDGEVGALVRAIDWSRTSLGAMADWTQSLRTAVDIVLNSPVAMVLMWGEDHVMVYNDAYAPIAGARHPKALGGTVPEIWPEIWDWNRKVLEAGFRGEALTYSDQAFTVERNGVPEEVWFDLFYTPVRDEHEQVRGVLCTVIETTGKMLAQRRQQRAEAALRAREDELSSIYDNVAEVLFYLAHEDDGSGGRFRFQSVNKAFLDATGLAESRVVGRLVQEVIPEPSCSTLLQHYREAIRQRATMRWEENTVYPSGARTGLVCVTPLFDAGDACTHLIGSVRDITQEKQAEAALKEETQVLELLNRTGVAIGATLDIETLLQVVTDAATQLTGAKFGAFFYNATNEEGQVYTLYVLSGASREAFEPLGHPRATDLFALTFNGGPPVRIADVRKDAHYGKWTPHHGMPPGHLPVVSYLAASVVSRSGEVIGGLFFGHPEPGVFTERCERLILGVAAQAAVAIDNARLYEAVQRSSEERKKLLASERAAREEAERVSGMKDEFLAMLAHELRNPLAPICSAAELLSMTYPDEPRVQQASSIIGRQVGHMTQIVDDLLDVSRVTRGLATVEKMPLEFGEVISGAIDQVAPLIRARRHELAVHAPAGPAWVNGDRTRLVQVFANILNNAAKYTPEGGVIEFRAERRAGELQVSVRDNGAGIEAALLPQIFELFIQGKRTPDRAQGGLGLGLALVRKLVELHGGSIAALSEGPGRGSEFVVRLPLLADGAASRQAHGQARGRAGGRMPAVLIVDDNADAADSLALLLRAEGCRVAVEYDAARALRRAGEEAPDVLLIDIGLPGIDGYELARRLRALPHAADAILVAVTGYGQQQDRERSKAAGFDHHLVKPVDMAQLLPLLETARR